MTDLPSPGDRIELDEYPRPMKVVKVGPQMIRLRDPETRNVTGVPHDLVAAGLETGKARIIEEGDA